jgi:predicted deacylase
MNPLGKGAPDRLRNDGSPVEVPVIVVNGAHDGPVVWLIGANHGDEYNGPAVIGVPVVNPLGFYSVSRTVTLDYEHFNFNRIWPGDPKGLLTQRIAHAIFTECVDQGGLRRRLPRRRSRSAGTLPDRRGHRSCSG